MRVWQALSLKIAFFKERPWAIRSRSCWKESDRVSIPLALNCPSLKKQAIRSKKIRIFHHVLTVFHWVSAFYAQKRIAPIALKQKSDCEWIAPIALYKRATSSELLPLLFTKEGPWAICFRPLYKRAMGAIRHFPRANRYFAHINERFAWKTKERIPSPGDW